jgi:hypothetical protein
MKTFAIDENDRILVFASKKEAAAASSTDAFSNQNELADLTVEWPMQRLVGIWNGLSGVIPVSKFTSRKIAVERLWKAFQSLEEAPMAPAPVAHEGEAVTVAPEPTPEIELAAEATSEPTSDETTAPATNDAPLPQDAVETADAQHAPETPTNAGTTTEPLATAGAQAPDATPPETPATQKATSDKRAPKGKRAATTATPDSGPREGTKMAQVVTMLQRKDGATLTEIMTTMGWQKHTVRGFMAGAMKKAGYSVESFKPEGGERTYRLCG